MLQTRQLFAAGKTSLFRDSFGAALASSEPSSLPFHDLEEEEEEEEAPAPAPPSSSLSSSPSSLAKTLDRLENTCIQADHATYAALLRQCSHSKALCEGRRIHSLIRKHVERNTLLNPVISHREDDLFHHTVSKHLERCSFLGNLVLQVYGSCGAADDARSLFDRMRHQDFFSWNFMMKAYVRQGNAKAALELFELMLQHGTMPNRFICVTLLSVFNTKPTLNDGIRIHSRIVNSELESDMIIETALLNMYSKCGNVTASRKVFDKMVKRDAVSWNAIIAAHAQQGQRKEALRLSRRMQQEGWDLNPGAIIALLAACMGPAALADGKWIHSQVRDLSVESEGVLFNALIAMYGKCGSLEDAELVFGKMRHRDRVTFLNMFAACGSQASITRGRWLHQSLTDSGVELDVTLGNALINMYGKCGDMGEAQSVFDRMDERDLIAWNALLSAYAQNNAGKCALHVLKQMLHQSEMPNKVTYVSVLDACAALEDEIQGNWVHASLRGSEFELDLILGTVLVHMCGKFNRMVEAKDAFDNILERDVACWNAIIAVFAHDEGKFALVLFYQMQEEGELPDKITFISTVTACCSQTYAECKRLHARILCTEFSLEIVLGNAIINMYGKCGGLNNALSFFEMMPMRDNVSYINVFSACSNNAALPEGRRIHGRIMGSTIESDIVIGNAILNMYGKCGSLHYALDFFDQMHVRNVVSFNIMITAHAQNGHVEMGVTFLKEMSFEGVRPDAVTFVCLLSTCSHAGLVDEGYGYLHLMTKDFGMSLKKDHFNCMIDMFARAGRLDEAEHLIRSMPCKPSVITWTTLLGACRNQVDLERGVRAAERVLKLNPERPSAYVTLSNIYMAAGREGDSNMIMHMMRTKGPFGSGTDVLSMCTNNSQL